MKIYNVRDKEFAHFGQVLEGFDTKELFEAMKKTPTPDGVCYEASDKDLEALEIAEKVQNNIFGGMPMQMGYCNGINTKLTALEYHKDSEINYGPYDFILLLALKGDMEDGKIDASKVKAFFCPKDTLVEVYATSLHYAPCSAKNDEEFKVLIGLPKGTNTEKPEIVPVNLEDKLLLMKNKWLLAHEDSPEAKSGAYVGLTGEMIDIKNLI